MAVKDTIKVREAVIESLKVGEATGTKITTLIETNTGAATVAFTTNNGPSGIGTTAISKWLEINIGGTVYFIPMWT